MAADASSQPGPELHSGPGPGAGPGPGGPSAAARPDDAGARLDALEVHLRQLHEERERWTRRRRRQMLLAATLCSLLGHIVLALYLASLYRPGDPRNEGSPVAIEFALVPEEELEHDQSTADLETVDEPMSELEDLSLDETLADLAPDSMAAELDLGDVGAMPNLGGGGGDASQGGGMGGSGSGTSFFGISSRGLRFCFVVDISGSMSGQRIERALGELARSIQGLPDYAYFHVLLYSRTAVEPPMQRGWARARREVVTSYLMWFQQVSPGGDTQPVPAFERAFGLEPRPDVVFFLTDGLIPSDTADVVAKLNARSRKVRINTIAFGDDASQDDLRRIAEESGGLYRFVAAEGR